MSGKNRAFALAIATAALVGFCAPMASAATFQGGPNTGFNNDSVLNVSNNQVPIQACNNTIPVNVAGIQVPIDQIAAAIGLGSGAPAATEDPTCNQTPTQGNTSNTTTTPDTTMGSNNNSNNNGCNKCGGGNWGGNNTNTSSSDPADNSGFNNDSILNVSNNQVPVQACNNTIPVNVLGIQVPVTGVAGALSALSGGATANQNPTCNQTPGQANTSNTTTG
jgi:hypothetical protein